MSGTLIYVVRHAEAGDRKKWEGPDEARPLSAGGRRQAKRLVESFATQPFAQLFSSPFVRCVQTLEPLADVRELTIEPLDQLAEGRPWEFLEKLILESEVAGPTAICVHGDSFRALMTDLIERGITEAVPRGYRKGSTWVLEVREGAIVSARHVRAPRSS